ncbi:hypothetical protein Poli38472_013045 [Pythium oligandrum]|uniref:VHS domain-containing protein n=1 Tax=Pythium oligandrum TaxID=41045 RepID=A0A8K1FN94_PYTOL|nr:hypothetical protein Poli38472_013045 [Pythium oligandrum]|eukprot:TMW64423.1 hypothetical protein Poli38472_013045 [Pythium oligandrum]
MDSMETKMAEWRRRMPSKRALTSQLGQFVQQKSVAVLYTQSEQARIKNITDLISKATCEFEKEEHWDRIMKVVDVLSNTANKNVLKESIRYLRLRLGDPSTRIVLLALTLTEALVKNCNRYVHKEIASEAFMGEMESLYKVHSRKRGRDSMEIESRALELIQAWGEAFMHQKFEYPYFIYTYEKLRKKGARFPKYNKDSAPIVTPPPRSFSSSSVSSGNGSRANGSVSSSSSSLAKLSSKEVYHVATNVAEMFEDMIHESEKDAPSIADRGVIIELAAQAQELVHRLRSVIESAAESDSDELGKYLSVNDTLQNALTRYEDLKKNGGKGDNQRRSSVASQSSNQKDNDDDDDLFADFVRARVGGGTEKKEAPSNNQTDEDDPFASFVQQRATTTTTPAKTGSAPAKDLIDLWDDEPVKPQTKPAVAPLAQMSTVDDLWGNNAFPEPVAAAPVSAPAVSASPFDDLWGDLVTPAPAAPVRTAPIPAPISAPFPAPIAAPMSAPAPMSATREANPFDFFEDFTQKATISTQAPAAAPVSKSINLDPFADFMAAPAPAPAPASQPAAARNPFDF